MSLSGVDPFDPTPANRREFKPNSGAGTGAASDLPYLIIGNRTTSGSETVDVISTTPLGDEADAIQRLGARSEAYWMYRMIRDVDPDGRIFVVCPPESGGVAAVVDLVVSGVSDADSSVVITCQGQDIEVPIFNGDTASATADRLQSYFNAADEGRLQASAGTPSLDGADYDVDITAALKGPRGIQVIGATATRGLRVRAKGPTNTQTVTKDIASYVAGSTADDHTAAIAEIVSAIELGLYNIVTPYDDVTAPAVTDNGRGELAAALKALAQPAVGRDTLMWTAVVGTNAQAVTVATDSDMNWWCAHVIWAENSDYTAAMIAAHVAAKVRVGQIAYPAYNPNGLKLDIPEPYLRADVATDTEIRTALNNGICPVTFRRGAMRLIRFITNQSLNDQGSNDYRAREGHTPRCHHWGWEQFLGRYEAQRQPNADDDPPAGQSPAALTTTPSSIKGIHDVFLDQAVNGKSLGYPGPIFKPSALADMKAKFSCLYVGAGAFDLQHDWKIVEHNIKTGSEIRGTNDAY